MMIGASLRTLVGTDLRRWWLATRCRAAPLREYYRVDYDTLDTPWDEVEFLAVDLETTGLDPRKDEIVSFGWVPISGGVAVLGEADHRLVRVQRPMPDTSATLTGILDQHLETAPDLAEVMPVFLAALTGRVPIAHHAPIEAGFLNAACRRLYGCPLAVPFVDTMVIEQRLANRRGHVAEAGSMRLQACRDRYGLPRYRAHNALADALSAGELLMAQASYLGGKKPAKLEELVA